MTAAPQVPLTPQLELADPEESPTRSLSGFWARFVSLTALGLAAFVLYTSGFGGYFAGPATLLDRALLLAAGVLLVFPGFTTDLIGAALLVLVWAKQRFFPAPAVSVA